MGIVYDLIKILNILYGLMHKDHDKQQRYGSLRYSPWPRVMYSRLGHISYKVLHNHHLLISTGINDVKDKQSSWKDKRFHRIYRAKMTSVRKQLLITKMKSDEVWRWENHEDKESGKLNGLEKEGSW